MATDGALTPTSYALLGLLAIRPWTTYELAKQMDRTLNRFWPRARSKLYEEPKKLVAQGWPRPRRAPTVGGPARSTRSRRRSPGAGGLAGGARAPSRSSSPSTSSRCSTPSTAPRADLLATLGAAARLGPRADRSATSRSARAYLQGAGPYPERLATLVLTGRFLDDYLEMIDRWATWATEIGRRPGRPSRARPAPTSRRWPRRSGRRRLAPSAGAGRRPSRQALTDSATDSPEARGVLAGEGGERSGLVVR